MATAATKTRTRKPAVQTVEITVGELAVGNRIKVGREWLPVRKVVSSDLFEGQLAIYTPKGLYGGEPFYPFETIDIAEDDK